MKNHRQGQMTIEAATLMILVVSGIILGGPVAIRGINAYFQGGEESVKESLRENIRTAGYVEGEFETCECSEPAALGCGDGPCDTYHMHYERICNPANCHFEWCATRGVYCDFDFCQEDENCCGPWTNTGVCGVNADPVRNPTGGHIPLGCPDGYMQQSQDCGGAVPNYRCNPDVLCEFHCVDSIGDDITHIGDYHAYWCPDDVESGLSSDTATTFVQSYLNCTGAKCEAFCVPSFTATADTCDCLPVDRTLVVFNPTYPDGRCYCDWTRGYVDNSGCSGSSCVNDGCAPDQCRVSSPY